MQLCPFLLCTKQGDIIGIINSDDFYAPETLNIVANVLKKNPDIGFVFGDQLFVDSQGISLFLQAGDAEYVKTIRHGMPSIPHPTVFVRREVYEQWGGFDESYKTAMDYEFLLRISQHGVKGEYIPAILAYMSLAGESERNFVRGYREVMRISIQYGYNPLLAKMRFCYKCYKTSLKNILEKVQLRQVVKVYRTLFSKRYLYNKK